MTFGGSPQDHLAQVGVLQLKQAGLTSQANVTEDGRVNISFFQNAANVCRLLAEAVRLQSNKATETTRGEQRNQYLECQTDTSSSLKLNVVIQIVGSRGDVQPFIAIAKVLMKNFGHRVRIATHPVFKDFVEQNGLEFFSIGGDPSELMAFMVKNPGLMPGQQALKEGQIGLRRKSMLEIMQRCWRSCFETGNGEDAQAENATAAVPFVADAIIANPPSFAHIHCAERLGIPLHMVFTMPWSPTQQFAHPLSNIKSSDIDLAFAHSLSYTVVELLTWQGLGDLVNHFREITLGLAPLTTLSGPNSLHRLRVPYSYCWSPALIPKPNDWGGNIKICGFSFLDQKAEFEPSNELKSFLAEGPSPIYIGFGSIVVDNPSALTAVVLDAIQRTGQRALLSKGWGGIGSSTVNMSSSVFLLGNVPHDWLFQHVSCVVHHGGAGTTAAGVAAGKPTVIIPFFGDQPFWGEMVSKAGAGPAPIPYSQLRADKLANAITEALRPSVIKKAQQLATIISLEDGSITTAEHFQVELARQHDRCSLVKDRKAVWKIRATDIHLSPLAASLLLKEKELSIDNLELLRARSYLLATGPLDPFSGGASALIGTIGSLMGGISDIPVDLFSRLQEATGQRASGASSSLTMVGESGEPEATLDSSTAQLEALHKTIDASRGAARIIGAGLKSPKDFTLALAKGFHNAPRLYGDDTVREQPKITGITSGIKAATSGLGYGFLDGITGLLRHPVKGLTREGLGGFSKGVGKAIGGIILKPAAGIWGVPGYFSEGIWQELRGQIATSSDARIVAGRIHEGEDSLQNVDLETKKAYLQRWLQLTKDQPRGVFRESKRPRALAKPAHFDQDVTAAIDSVSGRDSWNKAFISAAVESQLLRHEGGILPSGDRLSGDMSDAVTPASHEISVSETDGLAQSSLSLVPAMWDNHDIDSDDDENIKEAIRQSLHSNEI